MFLNIRGAVVHPSYGERSGEALRLAVSMRSANPVTFTTKRNVGMDWHKADIIAALHKKGISLAALSRENGLSDSTLANALTRPWPKGEKIIADALGMHPQEIWHSRYFDTEGNPIPRFTRK